MPTAFDPRRWPRRDQIAVLLGIVLGAVLGAGLGYMWTPVPESPSFVRDHAVLVLGGIGAIVGLFVAYSQGTTANDVPPDYP